MLIAVLLIQLLTLAAVWYAYTMLSWRCRRLEKWAQIVHADTVNSEAREETAKKWVEAID